MSSKVSSTLDTKQDVKYVVEQFTKLHMKKNYMLVVAIDFGTAFSGYAFSFKAEPEDIKVNRNWGTSLGFQSNKTPTCVLFDSCKNTVAFGYDAQKEYSELDEGEDQECYLFEFFKMKLHKIPRLDKDTVVASKNGKTMPALTVFAKSIEWLKDHFLKQMDDGIYGRITIDDIQWVLTVPAIWSHRSKNFMRQAAYQGGLIKELDSDKLVIALEPESASLFCRHLDINMYTEMCRHQDMKLDVGTKYFVLDAGGGTLDVTVHEVVDEGRAKELYYATGGPHGGMYVDIEFVKLLKNILGEKFIEEFQKKCPAQWLQLTIDFEQKKRACTMKNDRSTNISLLYALSEEYEEYTGEDIQKAFKRYESKGVRLSKTGTIVIEHRVMLELFHKITSQIVDHFNKLLSIVAERQLGKIEYIFMVGGFSDCNVLQCAIIDAFGKSMKVMIPTEASLAVVKGAVRFGHDTSLITERIAPRCYGIKVRHTYDPKKHKADRKEGDACYVFDILLEKYAKMGAFKAGSYQPTRADQPGASIDVYSSEERREGIMYIDDQGVEYLGRVNATWPGTGMDRKIEIYLRFGGTEIDVMVICQPGDVKTKGSVNCLE